MSEETGLLPCTLSAAPGAATTRPAELTVFDAGTILFAGCDDGWDDGFDDGCDTDAFLIYFLRLILLVPVRFLILISSAYLSVISCDLWIYSYVSSIEPRIPKGSHLV